MFYKNNHALSKFALDNDDAQMNQNEMIAF